MCQHTCSILPHLCGTLYIFICILGYFLCPKCNVHGEWHVLERLLKKTKIDVNTKEWIEKCHSKEKEFQNKWEHILKETTSINKLNESELKELFKLFEYPVSI